MIDKLTALFEAKMVQAKTPAVTETYAKMNTDIIQERSTVFSKIMLEELTVEEGLESYKTKVNGEL